jgi:high-affinity nickel-transport protein
MTAAAPPDGFRSRAALILGFLIFANAVAWAAALRVAGPYPILLGSAVLAYSLGLRHAFDADHIAVIDNVTRRLVATGARPAGVGFFFSLGHSSVVVAATIAVAFTASRFKAQFVRLQDILGPFGVAFSSVFLLCVAALNIIVFLDVWRAVSRQRDGMPGSSWDDTASCGVLGPFSRKLDHLIRRISRSGMMFPLGLLFALGFDTATEIALLGLAAAQAAKGLPIWSILIYPALFAAGMALADTLEGLFMLGAYRWTGTRPRGRLYYNLAATAASIVVGVVIALTQLAGLAPKAAAAFPALAAGAALLSSRSEWGGLAIVSLFAVMWGGWALADRSRSAATVPTPSKATFADAEPPNP